MRAVKSIKKRLYSLLLVSQDSSSYLLIRFFSLDISEQDKKGGGGGREMCRSTVSWA